MPFMPASIPMARECSLRRGEPAESAQRTGRVGDVALLALKAAALCLACFALLAWHLNPVLPNIFRNEACGVSMRAPRGWHCREVPDGLAAISRDDGRLHASVLLWRSSWADPAMAGGREDEAVPVGWPRNADLGSTLAEAAACLGLDVSGRARLEIATIAGRPALVLAAPLHTRRGWRAIAVAAGEDLLFAELDVSSEEDLRAVWRQWKAMLRSVRITGPNRPSTADATDW